jgi:hypothetical protein
VNPGERSLMSLVKSTSISVDEGEETSPFALFRYGFGHQSSKRAIFYVLISVPPWLSTGIVCLRKKHFSTHMIEYKIKVS